MSGWIPFLWQWGVAGTKVWPNVAWPNTAYPAGGSSGSSGSGSGSGGSGSGSGSGGGTTPPITAAKLWSTVTPSSPDYIPYLFDNPVKKAVANASDLLDFTLVPTDSNFVRLQRGAYIQFDTATYGTWFTGFVTSDPNLVYLGSRNGQPVYGYEYEATGEDYILNLKPLPLINPFMNMSQGQILTALVGILAPEWNFDTSGIQGGLTMARYVIDPTKHWSDVVKEFCQAANYGFACRGGKIVFQQIDSVVAPIVIDGNDINFTPANLSLTPGNDPIVNDSIVLGDIEPQEYMTEYFVGDGWNGKFPLIASCYGTDTTLLFSENFSGSAIDTTQNWDLYDEADSWIQVASGFCNALGGNNNGQYDVWMQSQFLFPLEGALRITHGEYDFVQTSDGVICGLWIGEPDPTLKNCLYGLKVSKTNTLVNGYAALTINPIVNGQVDTTQGTLLGNYNLRYVLRTNFTFQRSKRFVQTYSYLDETGTVQVVSQPMQPDTMTAQTWITSIDPETGTVITQPNGSDAFFECTNTVPIGAGTGFAFYIPVLLNDLHCSFTGITISTPLNAALKIQAKGTTTYVDQLIGQNEMDSYDGFTPVATVVDANQGATTRSSMLGRVQYNPGNAALEFFVDTVNNDDDTPNVGDIIQFTYRAAGASLARVQDKGSVAAESAAWGDNGLRSQVSSTLSPLPRTSIECESAAQAIVGDLGRQRWDGEYSLTNLYEATGEIVPSTVLKFQNLPTQFPSSLTAETIQQVTTTLRCISPEEVFDIDVQFSRISLQDRILAKFTKPNTPWQPEDDAQIPNAIDVSSVGLVFADDVTTPVLLRWDTGSYYLQSNQDAPSGGSFEVRYTDDSWGCDDAKNLVMRTTSQYFQVPRTLRGQVCWVRAQDGRNNCLYSEDLTAAAWVDNNGSSESNAMDYNPDGMRSLISTVVLPAGAFLQQTTAVSEIVGTQMVFSFSVKAATVADIGSVVSVAILSSSGTQYASVNVTLTNNWVRYSLALTATSAYSGGTYVLQFSSTSGANTKITRCALEVGTLTETLYCKTASTPYGATSRYSAGIHIALPLIPEYPTATVDTSDITAPVITVTLPAVQDNVWGYEIRAADNKTVLIHQDLIDAQSTDIIASQYQYTDDGNETRNPVYYVYTYNLLGEYSAPYDTGTGTAIPGPTVGNLAVDDTTKKLTWQGANASTYLVELDATDSTMSHVIRSVDTPDNFYVMQDSDFFPTRYIRVTPVDAIGGGPSAQIEHSYEAPAVVEFTAGECQDVPAPPNANTDPTIPPGSNFDQFSALIIAESWKNYAANNGRYG